jgi:hypothetical protein
MRRFPQSVVQWIRSIGGRLRKEHEPPATNIADDTPPRDKRRARVIPIQSTSGSGSGFRCPPTCWGSCCDDTVFLQARDVTAIHEFANRHYDRFAAHFANVWVWAGLQNLKLHIVPANFRRDDGSGFVFFRDASQSELVRHMPQSRQSTSTGEPFYHTLLQFDPKSETPDGCVFLTKTKSCFLEDVAIEAGEHPWVVKPEGCVTFPMVAGPDGVMGPLQSPQHDDPLSLHHGLLAKFADKACCTSVLPTNYTDRMEHVIQFVPAARDRRAARHKEWLSQHGKAVRKNGLLWTFVRPAETRTNANAAPPRPHRG